MLLKLGRGSGHGGGALAGVPSLKSAVSSCVADIDAHHYSSGQVWANAVALPADGSVRQDYDFFLGANGSLSTDDPAFATAPPRFTFDGGDYLDAAAMPAAALLRQAHKTNSSRPVTLGFAFRTPSSFGATPGRLVSTYNTSAAHGCSIRAHINGTVDIVQAFGTGIYACNIAGWVLAADKTYVLLVSFDSGAPGNERYWLNSAKGQSWMSPYAPNASTVDSQAATLGALTGAHSNALPAGYALYGVYVFNEILNDEKAGRILAALRSRHRRAYA